MTTTIQRDIHLDAFPPSDTPNKRTNQVIYNLISISPKERGYVDLTGRFPYRSSRGNEYILVGYNYDGNCILAEPVKNREAASITKAWQKMNKKFEIAGIQPEVYLLDNEISLEFKAALKKENISFQLVPPHCHRANLAERAIQTFKSHFKAGLASVNPDFPLAEWDRLIPQAVITLNLLRSARINPNLSAYAYVFGQFDYNKTPLAPPGTRVVAHDTPGKRATWALNGESGWTVGPAPDHYRCISCYFPRTRTVRQCDTVTYFPTIIPFPKVGLSDFLRQAAKDIVTILTHPPANTIPTLEQGSATNNALLKLATILQRIDKVPTLETTLETNSQTIDPLEIEHILHKEASLPRVQKQAPLPRVSKTAISKHVATSSSIENTISSDKLSPPTWARNKSFTQSRYDLRPRGTNFRSQAAQHIFNTTHVSHIYDDNGKKETLTSLLSGDNKELWTQALSNEWGRVANGYIFGK